MRWDEMGGMRWDGGETCGGYGMESEVSEQSRNIEN